MGNHPRLRKWVHRVCFLPPVPQRLGSTLAARSRVRNRRLQTQQCYASTLSRRSVQAKCEVRAHTRLTCSPYFFFFNAQTFKGPLLFLRYTNRKCFPTMRGVSNAKAAGERWILVDCAPWQHSGGDAAARSRLGASSSNFNYFLFSLAVRCHEEL